VDSEPSPRIGQRLPSLSRLGGLPRTVHHYRLLRRIGGGATGVVCEAEDTCSGARVAIKLMPHERAAEARPPRVPRRALAIRHPCVVGVHAAGCYAGGDFLVMELVDGPSLQALLDDGPLPWSEATALLAAACEGAAALHAAGVIHRDIKPANLLRAADGTVKLADLGLACLVTRSRSQAPAGTPHYMSPEQCRGEPCDERTDVYALGATYHALLTGRAPYAGATPWQVMVAHCSAPVPDPRQGRRGIPPTCAAIVQRAMAKKRGERYNSTGAMCVALRVALSEGRRRGG
jgi:serine/threonine protein kinase